MSSFSTAAEVSLRTETRKEGRKNEREGRAARATDTQQEQDRQI